MTQGRDRAARRWGAPRGRRAARLAVAASASAGALALVGVAGGAGAASLPSAATFSFTGEVATYTVPGGVCRVLLDVAGAQGGPNYYNVAGGLGGTAQATFPVNPGDQLGVVVGGAGTNGNTVGEIPGGFGGGGATGNGGDEVSGSGGGATSISQLNGAILLMAGGGGGTGFVNGPGGEGGNGGGANEAGAAGVAVASQFGGAGGGAGGTPNGDGAGGAAGASGATGVAGSLFLGGQGGAGSGTMVDGPGGGGGYFGGGGGGTGSAAGGMVFAAGGAGGGSGYAAPGAMGVTTWSAQSGTGNGAAEITPSAACVAPVLHFASRLSVSRVGRTYAPVVRTTGGSAPIVLSIARLDAHNCSISGGVVTFHWLGQCLILANEASSPGYPAARTATQMVVVRATPPSAPRDVAIQSSDGLLTVSWQPPADFHGGPLRDYLVSFFPVGPTCRTTTRSCSFAGPILASSTQVRVRAVNVAGRGPWSAPASLRGR